MTTATAEPITQYNMNGACDRDGCTTLECTGCEEPVAPTTARRTRRVRCTGCTDLIERSRLEEGLCPSCRMAPAETETVAREIRCRNCREWTPDGEITDGLCDDCWQEARDAIEAENRDAEQAEAERAEALAEVERLMVSSATPTPATARTPGWQPVGWELVIMVGSQKTVVRTGLTFDEAQIAAKELARAETEEYNARQDEGVEPVRAIWRNVKRWDVADFHIEIHRLAGV